ncbi:tumor necrosis factor receptor superfamily member 23-like [Astyanax mexicanus]|uniref:Tumor necrosis factor receptor superfamily member 23-like n=1 Tax=Astyanax mexicanus TaxID=7994 RepID=A0A8T2KNZ2_ASTMX|nr:tumor necrosis factor receptor superfamily member 23-like [Astyanax mexicanus]
MKPCLSVSLVLMRFLYQHSVSACPNGYHINGNTKCCLCQNEWFLVNCSMASTQCLPCTNCEQRGQKTVTQCTKFSDAVCETEPSPTPVTLAQPEWTVIALYVTASVVLLLIISATACKLYLNHKAPLDPAKKPLKTPSLTESMA